jgi:hypothetical protein
MTEYVLVCWGPAVPIPELQHLFGSYLEWSDVDANDGRGDAAWTRDIDKAMKFTSFSAAIECWQQRSMVRPRRPDGLPNRPLTAFTVEPRKVEDVDG